MSAFGPERIFHFYRPRRVGAAEVEEPRFDRITRACPPRQIAVRKSVNVSGIPSSKREAGPPMWRATTPQMFWKQTPNLPVAVLHTKILKKVWIFSWDGAGLRTNALALPQRSNDCRFCLSVALRFGHRHRGLWPRDEVRQSPHSCGISRDDRRPVPTLGKPKLKTPGTDAYSSGDIHKWTGHRCGAFGVSLCCYWVRSAVVANGRAEVGRAWAKAWSAALFLLLNWLFLKAGVRIVHAAFSDILALDGDVTTACLASLSSTIVNRVTRVTARFREKTKLRSAPGIGGDPCFRYENMRKRSLVWH